MEDCPPWERPHTGAGKSVRNHLLRKEWQRQRVMNWPQPHSPSPCVAAGGRRWRKPRVKWSHEEGRGEKMLRFDFISSYTAVI